MTDTPDPIDAVAAVLYKSRELMPSRCREIARALLEGGWLRTTGDEYQQGYDAGLLSRAGDAAMSARDEFDHPSTFHKNVYATWEAMCDEIDALRSLLATAAVVIADLDGCTEPDCGCDAALIAQTVEDLAVTAVRGHAPPAVPPEEPTP